MVIGRPGRDWGNAFLHSETLKEPQEAVRGGKARPLRPPAVTLGLGKRARSRESWGLRAQWAWGSRDAEGLRRQFEVRVLFCGGF